jgi:hypothetical protein
MQFKDLIPAVVLSVVIFAITLQARFSAPENGRVGIFFPPWTAADDAFLRVARVSSVQIVSGGAFGNIIIAELSDSMSKARIYDAGAWWMFDPDGFGGCFSPPENGV